MAIFFVLPVLFLSAPAAVVTFEKRRYLEGLKEGLHSPLFSALEHSPPLPSDPQIHPFFAPAKTSSSLYGTFF